MSFYSSSTVDKHPIKGYRKAYHFNKQNKKRDGRVEAGEERREIGKGGVEGKDKRNKNPLILYSTNVLDQRVPFSNNTINSCRVLAFPRTELWKY